MPQPQPVVRSLAGLRGGPAQRASQRPQLRAPGTRSAPGWRCAGGGPRLERPRAAPAHGGGRGGSSRALRLLGPGSGHPLPASRAGRLLLRRWGSGRAVLCRTGSLLGWPMGWAGPWARLGRWHWLMRLHFLQLGPPAGAGREHAFQVGADCQAHCQPCLTFAGHQNLH